MIRYKIPSNLLPGFKLLAHFSDEEIKTIAQVVQSFTVGGSAREFQVLLEDIKFVTDPNLLSQTLFSFGELLLNANGKLTSLAKDLGIAYAQGFNEKSIEEKGRLEQNLLVLFEHAANLKQTFKAFQVLLDNKSVYRQSKVLTDIRMIFNDDLEQDPKDGLIIHQLKIEQVINNAPKETFISLTHNDLLDLEKQLKRAKEKEKQLKKIYSELNFINFKN